MESAKKLGLSEQEFKNFISDDFTDLFTNDPDSKGYLC